MAMSQAERDAMDAADLARRISETPERLRKKNEFNPVTVLTSAGSVIITPTDKTLARLYAVVVSGAGVSGWRADNGVFDLTNADALLLYQAGQNNVRKAFIAESQTEGGNYSTVAEAETAYDTAYNQA